MQNVTNHAGIAQTMQLLDSIGEDAQSIYKSFKTRSTQKGIVGIMANPDMDAEQKERAMMQLPFHAENETFQYLRADLTKKRAAKERIDYQLQLKDQLYQQNQDLQQQTYADQGFSEEEIDLANRVDAGLRPTAATDKQKQYRDQLKFWTTERDKAAGDYYGLGIAGVSNDPIDPIMFKKANEQIAILLAESQGGGGQPIPEIAPELGGEAQPLRAPQDPLAPTTPQAQAQPIQQQQQTKGQIYNKINEFMDIRKDYKSNPDDFDRLITAVQAGELTMDEAVELIRQSRNE